MYNPSALIVHALLGCLWFLSSALLPATDVQLRSPLTTIVPFVDKGTDKSAAGLLGVEAEIIVPDDAPADLGVGAFATDRHGVWFQVCRPGVLAPGRQTLRFTLGADDVLMSEPLRRDWTAAMQARMAKTGIFFWSTTPSHAVISIVSLHALPATEHSSLSESTGRLLDLHVSGADGTVARGTTGERWTVSVRPDPLPSNPDDPRLFTLDAVITTPDGATVRIPGFSFQPMVRRDRGDREEVVADGAWCMEVRYRPRLPGRYRLHLEARWNDGPPLISPLPDLVVSGAPWDGYVHVDPTDPRFFSVAGAFWWPIGLNLHGVYDERSADRLNTHLTPDRGSLATIAQLERLAAGGGNATEIWMASWNLGLEWRGDWPGFDGIGRFSQENAAKLDAVLDAAWSHGVRVNLVLNNHGQASARSDSEWADNPWNASAGGPLSDPLQLFTDPVALAGQERLRRYLVARFADHPAILGWKLWSEINLTAGGTDAASHAALRTWHEQAAARWQALDTYGHPLSTHWAGDFRKSDWDIASLPGLGYLCIDAYHGGRNKSGGSDALSELLAASVLDPTDGLGRFHKPILVTEFGGSAMGATEVVLQAEHASGAWSALVSGHGGAPMLWWFEWVDQHALYQPYRAIGNFLHGEDLRGADARAVILEIQPASPTLWAQAWSRPGRMLGYVVDRTWEAGGAAADMTSGTSSLLIGAAVAPGTCHIQWWNPADGSVLREVSIVHAGGPLLVPLPAFQKHLAFKLWRSE